MSFHTRHLFALLLPAVLVVISAAASQQSSARDVPPAPAVGTAVVSGVVLTAEARPTPVRRARVALMSEGGVVSLFATTDDNGRFSIGAVPKGRYTLEASKPAWLTAVYGAKRPGRSGTPITVGDERVPPVEVRMSRGGVITGTVIDRTGQPVPGVAASALRYTFSELSGERTLRRPAAFADSTTDDQGVFRFYGLPPGEYIVAATLRAGAPAALMDLMPMTGADVDRALKGQGPSNSASTVGFAPFYFPGTADPGQAQSIRLAVAEERTGVTLRIEPVATAAVETVPTLPSNADPASLQVFLVSARVAPGVSPMAPGRRDSAGRYVFNGVTPGNYTLIARAATAGATAPAPSSTPPGGRGRGPGPAPTLYAAVDVAVAGQNMSVPLELQPGMAVSGRVTFAGDSARAPVGAVSLALLPTREGVSLGVSAAPVDAAGSFSFVGVPPGRYRLVQAAGPTTFQLTSAVSSGRDVLDTWLTVSAGESIPDLMVTFSERVSELSGRLESTDGGPAPDYFIVAFSTDRERWTPLSRRVRQSRPATDGRFSIRGLPSGDYFLAAVTDVEPGEWFDPAFLSQLVSAAVKVTVRDGEQTIQNLRIK
jgi:hypothetical protein